MLFLQLLQESVLVCELLPVLVRLVTHTDLLVVSSATLALWNLAREPLLRSVRGHGYPSSARAVVPVGGVMNGCRVVNGCS